MLDLESIKNSLGVFVKDVVNESRSNLLQKNVGTDSPLYNAIDGEFEVGKNSFRIKFFISPEGEVYGEFQDRGVKGSDPSLIDNPDKNKKGIQKAPYDTPFSFKNKKPPYKAMLAFVKKRKIRLRDDKGKFAKGSYEGIAWYIQKSVFAQGIPAKKYFSDAFEKNFKEMPSKVKEDFGLELKSFMAFTIKENLGK